MKRKFTTFVIALFSIHTLLGIEIDSIGLKVIEDNYYILYLIKHPTTSSELVEYFKIEEKDILEANPNIKIEETEVPFILKIPYIFEKKAEKKDDKPKTFKYILEKQENIYDLAKRFDMTITHFRELNNPSDLFLDKGTEILVETKDGKYPESIDKAKNNIQEIDKQSLISKKYKIKKNETLYRIALQYDTKEDSLLVWNDLKKNQIIKVGQVIIVGYETPLISNDIKPVIDTSKSQNNTPIAVEDTTRMIKIKTTPPKNKTNSNNSIYIPQYISEEGLALKIENDNSNVNTRRLSALHPNLENGTLIKVINLENNQKILAKVIGQLKPIKGEENVILKLSEAAYKRLKVVNEQFRVKIEYNK